MAQTLPEDELIAEFPVPRRCPLHPQTEYAALQAERPVARVRLPSGCQAVALTRLEDVREVLRSSDVSADERLPGYPFLYEQGFQSPLAGTFMRVDGEAHQRIRRMLAPDFSSSAVAALRPVVEGMVAACLDAMESAGPPADLVAHLALPLPSRTICRVLGVPDDARGVVEASAGTMIDVKSSPEQVQAAMGAIFQYLHGLVAEKEHSGSDDLLGRLVREELVPGNLSRDELVTIALILLVAGHETTSAQIGLSVYALLQHPDQVALLREDPSLWPKAVDELLRHQTIVQAPTQRVAVEDVEVAGETVAAGEGILAVLSTANRDPRAFEDPDRLDVTRGTRRHVAFSFGPHACLGHALARMELEVALSGLFARFPGLELAVPVEDVPLKPPSVNIFGVESLPVTW